MSDVIRELREKITIAREHERWREVKELAQDLISRTTGNGFALRAMVQAAEHLDEKEDLPPVLTALVEEAKELLPYAGQLAAYHASAGHRNRAVHYYEIALNAAIKDRAYDLVETYWIELAALAPERLDLFCKAAQQLRSAKQHDQAAELLDMLSEHYEAHGTAEEQLALAREVAFCRPGDIAARRTLIDAYRQVHRNHANFERLVEHSGLASTKPIDEAVAILERELTFDTSECVYHSGWGVGVIRKLDPERGEVTIDFGEKRGHVMTLDMAERTLKHLDRDDFRSLLATNAGGLAEQAEKYPVELVRSVLKSLNNSANAKQIKEKLVDVAVPMKKWAGWWNATCELLKKDPYVEITGSGANRKFMLRARPMTPDDDYLARFESAYMPLERLAVFAEYVQEMRGHLNSSTTQTMLDTLVDDTNKTAAPLVKAQLLLTLPELAEAAAVVPTKKLPALQEAIPADPSAALNIMENLEAAAHKTRWAEELRHRMGDSWSSFVLQVFPAVQDETRDILARCIEAATAHTHYERWFSELIRKPQTNPGLFLWLAREVASNNEVAWYSGDLSTLVDQVLRVLDFATYRAKSSSRREEVLAMRAHVSMARRILKAGSYNIVRRTLKESTLARAARLLKAIKEQTGLDEQTRKDLVRICFEAFPELANMEDSPAAGDGAAAGPLFCLESSLRSVRERMRQIRDVEMPQTTREIEIARAHGDLRENAEYHAARNHHRFLQAQMADLEAGASRARIITANEVDTSRVGFGCRVSLRDVATGAVETFTVLGPWESAPEQAIYSYQSPMIQSIWGAELGAAAVLRQGEEEREVIIERIENALA